MAAERDEAAIAAWRDGPGSSFEASGGDRRVPLLRGRGRAGHAPAEGPHLGPEPLHLPDPRAYRTQRRAPQHARADYASLITAGHTQLHAALILVLDNLNTHISAVMRTLLQPHQGSLTVVRLPATPRPEPAEGAWSNMKNSLGNLGSCSTVRQLAAIIKNRLKRIQYRPALIDGFLAQTGLSPEPEPP